MPLRIVPFDSRECCQVPFRHRAYRNLKALQHSLDQKTRTDIDLLHASLGADASTHLDQYVVQTIAATSRDIPLTHDQIVARVASKRGAMNKTNRSWLYHSLMIFLLFGMIGTRHIPSALAQDPDLEDYDGVDVYAEVDFDSNAYLYVDSYTEVVFDLDEDIDEVQDEITVGEDDEPFFQDYGNPDEEYSEYKTSSTSPVAVNHEYEVESDALVCFDDGEGDCDTKMSATHSRPPIFRELLLKSQVSVRRRW